MLGVFLNSKKLVKRYTQTLFKVLRYCWRLKYIVIISTLSKQSIKSSIGNKFDIQLHYFYCEYLLYARDYLVGHVQTIKWINNKFVILFKNICNQFSAISRLLVHWSISAKKMVSYNFNCSLQDNVKIYTLKFLKSIILKSINF